MEYIHIYKPQLKYGPFKVKTCVFTRIHMCCKSGAYRLSFDQDRTGKYQTNWHFWGTYTWSWTLTFKTPHLAGWTETAARGSINCFTFHKSLCQPIKLLIEPQRKTKCDTNRQIKNITSCAVVMIKWRFSHPGWVCGPWPPAPGCRTEVPQPWSRYDKPALRWPTATSRGRQSYIHFFSFLVLLGLREFDTLTSGVMMHVSMRFILGKQRKQNLEKKHNKWGDCHHERLRALMERKIVFHF